jgi:hypothetical protein
MIKICMLISDPSNLISFRPTLPLYFHSHVFLHCPSPSVPVHFQYSNTLSFQDVLGFSSEVRCNNASIAVAQLKQMRCPFVKFGLRLNIIIVSEPVQSKFDPRSTLCHSKISCELTQCLILRADSVPDPAS